MKKEIFALAALALCVQPGQASDVVSDQSPRFAAVTPIAAVTPAEKAPAGVAATVNGDKIMMVEINRMVEAVAADKPELKADLPEAKAAVETIRQKILGNLIERRLLVQEARRRKIVPAAADINKGVTALRGGANDADYAKQLAAQGRTAAEVRQFVTDELAVRELANRLTADLTVPESEIKAFYDGNPTEWEIPETARAHHILLAFGNDPNAVPTKAQKDAAYKRAQDVLNRVKARNADWNVIARKYSDDGSKESGGNLGEFALVQMVPPFAKAVQDAKIGVITGPVETQYGYHIIRVDARTPASALKLAQVRDNVKVYLLQQKIKEKLNQQITALRSTATIRKFM